MGFSQETLDRRTKKKKRIHVFSFPLKIHEGSLGTVRTESCMPLLSPLRIPRGLGRSCRIQADFHLCLICHSSPVFRPVSPETQQPALVEGLGQMAEIFGYSG